MFRPVDGGDTDARATLTDGVLDDRSRRQDGGHRADAALEAARQASAHRNQPQTVGQREHAGDARRGVLAHAVTEHGSRTHAPTPPQFCQRPLQGKHRRLCVRRVPFHARRVRAPEQAEQGGVQMIAQQRRTLVDRRAEDRLGLVQLAAHAGVLRALSGEQERDARTAFDLTARKGPPFGQRGLKRRARGRHEDCALGERRPPGIGRQRDIAERLFRMSGQMCARSHRRARRAPRAYARRPSAPTRRGPASRQRVGRRQPAPPRRRGARWFR